MALPMYEYFRFVMFPIMLVWCSVILFVFVRKYIRTQLANNRNPTTHSGVNPLMVLTIIVLVGFCIAFSFMLIRDTLISSTLRFHPFVSHILIVIASVGLAVGMVGIYVMLVYRLKFSFQNSQYAVKQNVLYFHFVIGCIIAILIVFIAWFRIKKNNPLWAAVSMLLCFTFLIAGSQLVYSFNQYV